MARKMKTKIKCDKLLYFSTFLMHKIGLPELSYFDYVIEETDDKITTGMVPFYLGALQVLEEVNPALWKHLLKDKDIWAEDAIETVVNSTCEYFGISHAVFAHFFAPNHQNQELTDTWLAHNVGFNQIGQIIFDFVLNYKLAEYERISKRGFVQLN